MLSSKIKIMRNAGSKLLLAVTLLIPSFSGCGLITRSIVEGVNYVNNSPVFRQGEHGEISVKEMEWAKVAWKYFENNNNPFTGLSPGFEKSNMASMYDIADYLSSLVSAHQNGLINNLQFNDRLTKILNFLNTMPLLKNNLPNRYYSISDGMMVDKSGKKGEYGWSAMDLGRLLVWLKIVSVMYPEYSEYIDKAVLRWNFCEVVDPCGNLYSGIIKENIVSKFEEGRLGFEEYAAKGFQLWKFNTDIASMKEPFSDIRIKGLEIYFDQRNLQISKIPNSVTVTPYVFEGMEFNWDTIDDNSSMDSVHTDEELFLRANNIYLVQELRYRDEKIFTAKSEHMISNKPFIIQDSIFSEGYIWNTITENGEYLPNLALVSTKAVFGMWSLWKTNYSSKLMKLTETLYDPQRGWFEGRYEKSGSIEKICTLSTNAMVLESLLYKKIGKIYFNRKNNVTYYDSVLNNEFKIPQKSCFPTEKRICR